MYTKLSQSAEELPPSLHFILSKTSQYLEPFLEKLDSQIDKRLVRTFCDVFTTILSFRERHMGLLLSELGGYLTGFDKAPAGTKRISNLLRSKKWTHPLVDEELFARCGKRVDQLEENGKQPLFLWDDSKIEKHESWFSEGLCSVHSSKGQRLTKIKKGFYYPPVKRICVPGFLWTGVVLTALGEAPTLLKMEWWTTRGKYREQGCNIIFRLLRKIQVHFGTKGLHIFDRGFAYGEMIEYLLRFEQSFLIRWISNRLLVNEKGEEKLLHRIARSYKGTASRLIRDKERKSVRKATVAWAPVRLPDFPENTFYLLILRDANGKSKPIYWLTSQKIETKKQAWKLCFYYMKRWEVEQVFRFAKSEMGIEAARLWFWENRLKLMAIVAMVIDFLFSLLNNWGIWCRQLLESWCHRTGNRCRNASTPVYRLRAAISNCLSVCFGRCQFSG